MLPCRLCHYSCCYSSVFPYISGAAGGFPQHPSCFCTFSLLCECVESWIPAAQATFCLISFPGWRVIPARELGAAAAHPSTGQTAHDYFIIIIQDGCSHLLSWQDTPQGSCGNMDLLRSLCPAFPLSWHQHCSTELHLWSGGTWSSGQRFPSMSPHPSSFPASHNVIS